MERVAVATEGGRVCMWLISVRLGRLASTPFDICWGMGGAKHLWACAECNIVSSSILNHNHILHTFTVTFTITFTVTITAPITNQPTLLHAVIEYGELSAAD